MAQEFYSWWLLWPLAGLVAGIYGIVRLKRAESTRAKWMAAGLIVVAVVALSVFYSGEHVSTASMTSY